MTQQFLSWVYTPKNGKQLFKQKIVLDENVIIDEGSKFVKETKTRARSKSLRAAAIKHFSEDDGKIKCQVCGCEMSCRYGEYGKGFIEIHHIKPICQYEDDDVNKTLEEALQNLAPLCPDCHRMVHQAAKKMDYNGFKAFYKNKNQ